MTSGRSAVLVPTGGAAIELRRTLSSRFQMIELPDILTRADFYDHLQQASGRLPLLSASAREVLLRRAARAVQVETPPPFSLRPGLVREMLRFYDELRRREQTLDDFNRKVTAQLEGSAETDRGAERLLRQTTFMVAAFEEFERLSQLSGGLDEHRLRADLLAADATLGSQSVFYTHVVVTTADQTADPRGLYASDFDLLARLPGVDRIDVISTENLLASGFHERIHDLLPGIEEVKVEDSAGRPTLVAPPASEEDRRWFTCRDREEELKDFVRDLRQRPGVPESRAAIVYQRPLPYLYLAKHVCAESGIPFQSADALPLSSESFAAAIDLVLSFLTAEGNRASTIALLSSPQFAFPCDANSVSALDRTLRDAKFAGGWDRLAAFTAPAAAADAFAAAQQAASGLAPVRTSTSARDQFATLIDFVHRFERTLPEDAPWAERHLRARTQVLAAIETFRDAQSLHDDERLSLEEYAGGIRRWIDAQTFSPGTSTDGVRLMDAAAATYADVDEVRILGLVEADWPEPVERRIFYPPSILAQLGWPADARRSTAARARFRDLIMLSRKRVSGSTFTLEDDVIVGVSPFVEELESCDLTVERRVDPRGPVFVHEHVAAGSSDASVLNDPGVAEWVRLRASRSATEDVRYHGQVGPRPGKTYAVSHVERYLECPFKYYASQVLRLPEEREDESGLTPQERGQFVHEVFERFFREWQRAGRQTITTTNVAEALALFERVVDSKLDSLPEADRSLERTHLLGSAASAGLAERAFAFEIEQEGEVVERLLEHTLEGTFELESASGKRTVAIRAKADRIDLMADGTLRVIDYKLGRAPKLSRALQLPIYGVCATQALDGHRNRTWRLDRAGYVAFREKDAFVPLGGRSPLASALKEGQQRFVDAVDAIERGEFPVRPDEPYRCRWCGYASVCRKDYVGDE